MAMTGVRAIAKTATSKGTKEKPGVRAGRPRRELAGEVDARILDAADRVFKERGLAGASIDEIARLAPVSKPTLYARFPGKEELFTAVLLRNIDAKIVELRSPSSGGATVQERLIRVGNAIAQEVLAEDTMALLRLAIAEAQRFPDLAHNVDKMLQARLMRPLGKLLGEIAPSDELGASPAFAQERLASTAKFFIDLTVTPLIMRAMLGAKLETVRALIGSHVANSAPVFLVACREACLKGWRDDWDDD